MDISFEYYKAFYYVAKHRSISKAAVEMQKGQPNNTKTIANLEWQLGCKLFVRSTKGMQLTPEGETLFQHVAIAIEHILTGEKKLIDDQSIQSGVVTVATSDIALRCCLLPVLEEYRRCYPGVRIRLSNYSRQQAIAAVKNHLADFAIVSAPSVFSDHLQIYEISHIQQVLVCGEVNRELVGKPISPAELSRLPMICMNPATATFQFLKHFFENHGIELRPEIEVATADQIIPLIRANLGVGFVPEQFLVGEERIYKLHMTERLPSQVICLLCRTDTPLSIASTKLKEMLMHRCTVQ